MTFDVTYNGKTIKTKNWEEVTPQELEQYRQEFYRLPDKNDVLKQMQKINNGGVMIDKITRYYFRELMAKVQHAQAKWSVEDVFSSTDLCGVFKAKVHNSPKVFNPEVSMGYNIERAIALGGKGYAKIPTQFPVKIANEVYEKYNSNGIVYDFSCGWGARLVSALKHKLVYYGTDPNYLLCEKLSKLTDDWQEATLYIPNVDIRAQGSEIFVSEWAEKVGLAFSSPPYFSLEDYKIGNQSWKNGTTYQKWLEEYMYPTLENCIKYLIKNGHLAINIKNTTVPIATDVNNYLKERMNFVDAIPLRNIKRLKSTGGLTDSTDELVYIYRR